MPKCDYEFSVPGSCTGISFLLDSKGHDEDRAASYTFLIEDQLGGYANNLPSGRTTVTVSRSDAVGHLEININLAIVMP